MTLHRSIHTIPYPFGPTHPSNLKCLCRKHHLLKTFWTAWRDEQRPDGTIIWTLPDGHTHVTTPGSALLFPALCASGDPPPVVAIPDTQCDNREAMMPTRTHTRAPNHAARIAAERQHNRTSREARKKRWKYAHVGPSDDDEPPPF